MNYELCMRGWGKCKRAKAEIYQTSQEEIVQKKTVFIIYIKSIGK